MIQKQKNSMKGKMILEIQLLPQSAQRISTVQTELLLFDDKHVNSQDKSENMENKLYQLSHQLYSRFNYNFAPVPIIQIKKKKQWMYLNPNNLYTATGLYEKFARGILIGKNNLQVVFQQTIDFLGNFQGVFESGMPDSPNIPHYFYFEGNINEIKILRIADYELTIQEQSEYQQLSNFEGYFKGFVLQYCETKKQIVKKVASLCNLTKNQVKEYEQKHIRSKISSKTEYFVPAFCRFQVGRIKQIDLGKSSANIWGTLYFDIQLNQDIALLLQAEWSQKRKIKLHLEYNRNAPLVLPFYDPQEFQNTEEDTQYEWDDIWQGINWTVSWDKQKFRMSYSLQYIHTVQINNSHGSFYAPFNLNFLKIVVCFHTVKINSRTLLNITVCDLHDFNQFEDNTTKRYNPYTNYADLKIDWSKREDHQIYQKHIDRQTKISTPSSIGEYKIATNRLFLFPYHKRVFINSNTLSNQYSWMLGLCSRSSHFRIPEVYGVSQSFEKAMKARQMNQEERIDVFKIQRWNYLHIEIPIYKYPVIDLIRIFVPIIILATISQLIFGQENGIGDSGYTLFAYRIGSGCSILLAYVALIPMLRNHLPPTPALTLIEIVIYLSTIPNFLAIISVYIVGSVSLEDFFAKYKPFVDGLFITSFLICVCSFLALVIMVTIYISKNYEKPFTLKNFKKSEINRICSPFYLEYMDLVQKVRKEITIHKIPIFYPEDQNQNN